MLNKFLKIIHKNYNIKTQEKIIGYPPLVISGPSGAGKVYFK
jgi:hypothetical protein